MDFNTWTANMREVLQEENKPISLQNGLWTVSSRKELLHNLGSRVFDQHLETLKECAIDVLSELDPQFELPPDERYAASVKGKVLTHSKDIREGLAEALALLGTSGDALVNSSKGKAESIVILTLREVFKSLDWKMWASLGNLLPTLAEAAPGEFLRSVEDALKQAPCPFDELFAQEGAGITGGNYMTGLLWALETLSWSEEHIVRVALILAELATHDPGGNWCNRPSNSLITILLPWHPQTLASIDKRFSTVRAIKKEFPEVAWQVLLSMLPNQHQTSTGAYKPRWRDPVPEEWKPQVVNEDYWKQVGYYAELSVEMACDNLPRLTELVDNLDNLPKDSFEAVLDHVSSEIITLDEDERMPVWLSLIGFANKHRRFSDAKWALSDNLVSKIEAVAEKISPTSLEGQYRRLFSNNDHDLYEENGDWEKQCSLLDDRRQQAIQALLDASGLDRVIAFNDSVEAPRLVGLALGKVGNEEIDSKLLPFFLDDKINSHRSLVHSFILSRLRNLDWNWVDELDRDEWTQGQSCEFLLCLPFDIDTWTRVASWLSESANEYWKKANIEPYWLKDNTSSLIAVKHLLDASRPIGAIKCLYYHMPKEGKLLDRDLTVKALLAAVSTEETISSGDPHHITELIKALQNDSETDEDDLFNIEWAYLKLLNLQSNSEPKYLEKRLATQPDFFCEVICLIYRPRDDKEPRKELDEHSEAVLTCAWHLMHDWKRMPGLDDDELFSATAFKAWLESVKKQCIESGRFEVAMSTVGGVLFYCPPDPDGLWIIKEVAEALNERDAEELRKGFYFGAVNSRGVHWIDPTGQPERNLADQWRQKAEQAEEAGYARLAITARDIAKSYDREAERIIDEHKQEEAEDKGAE